MSFSKSLLIFAFLMATGLIGYRIAWGGLYPLILVNYSPIYSNEIDHNLAVAYDYYRNALLYSGSDPKKLDAQESYNDLKRAVMDEAISQRIIFQKLKSEMGSADIAKISERNIENALSKTKNMEQGVERLYGLSLSDFKEQILLPEAYREILEGRMNLNNQDFSSWLKKSRVESNIFILSPIFGWDGERVFLK